MNNCEKYIALISECIDGELSDADRSELKAHLEICPECRKVAKAFAAIKDNFPKEEKAPENFTIGTMAKIKTESARPVGIKKFISGYGKYTGIAAAFAVVLLGATVFMGGGPKDSSAHMAPTAYSATADSAPAEAPAEAPGAAAGSTKLNSAYDSIETATEDRGVVEGKAFYAPAEPESQLQGEDNDGADIPVPESEFSASKVVTDINELYKRCGYNERFYSISRMIVPVSPEIKELLNSDAATEMYCSASEIHYKLPLSQLNELDPEVFTEIVFDDLTAQYGLVILTTAKE